MTRILIDADKANCDWPKRTPDTLEALLGSATLSLSWEPELHPRWPRGAPGGKGGEFMHVADLLDELTKIPSRSMDVSFLARGADHISAVTATLDEDSYLPAIQAHISHPTTGSFVMSIVPTHVAETAEVQQALGMLDRGASSREVATAPGILSLGPGDGLTYRRFRTLIGAQPVSKVSELFDVNDGLARDAMGPINEVHGQDEAPASRTIPLTVEPDLEDWGAFYWASLYGAPGYITIHEDSPEMTLTVLHEVGHYADRQILGQNFFQTDPTIVSLDAEGAPIRVPAENAPPLLAEMEHVFSVIEQSDARRHMVSLLDSTETYVDFTLVDGTRISGPLTPDETYTRYLLRRDETFARAYAQWIALRSGDPDAVLDVEAFQEGGVSQHRTGYWYGAQWAWRDFAAIAEAMDELFAAYGLLLEDARGADPGGLIV